MFIYQVYLLESFVKISVYDCMYFKMQIWWLSDALYICCWN